MAKKVPESKNVVWVNADSVPDVKEAGFYEIVYDDNNDQTNGVSYGKKVEWQKNTPDPEDGQADPENNEGSWFYAE